MDIKVQDLTFNAMEMLGQLFVSGPVWDGNVVSKDGRARLVEMGMCERGDGFTWLTRFGVETALHLQYDPNASRAWKRKADGR
jgi:hypothetical protein